MTMAMATSIPTKHIVKKNWVATKNAGEDLRLVYTVERSMGIISNRKRDTKMFPLSLHYCNTRSDLDQSKFTDLG